MKIGIDMGHPLDCGANEIMNETVGNRQVGNLLINKLRALGHTVINCTVDDNTSELVRRVANANAQQLDYFISLHMDSFTSDSANGVSIFTTENSGAKTISKGIIDLVAKSCNYTNRGWKSADYYVLKNTIAPAMLIEMGFVSNKGDCNKFNAENIANAIVNGLTGQTSTIQVETLKATPTPEKPVIRDNWVKRLQGITGASQDGIPGPITLSKCPLVRKDTTGEVVKLLQEQLKTLGYDCYGIDGYFGNNTKQAVIRFQNNSGLSADGIVGQNTWRKLLGLN